MPNDPVLLLSFVNTQLRDRFPTLERLAAAYMVSADEIKAKLKMLDYEYDENLNKFV